MSIVDVNQLSINSLYSVGFCLVVCFFVCCCFFFGLFFLARLKHMPSFNTKEYNFSLCFFFFSLNIFHFYIIVMNCESAEKKTYFLLFAIPC